MREEPDQDQRTRLAQWIVAVANKDRAAFASLFEHFAPRVKTMMLRAGLSPQRAEDLAQDTMLAVWNKAHLFDQAGAGPSAWIFTIARNLRIDVLRREQRADRVESSAFDQPPPEEMLPDAALVTSQSEEQVRAALARLSPEQLQIVRLSFFEDRPHGEISQTLGLPLGTVKSRLRLAMKHLRKLLEEPQ
jgi:RNA polymerase sigma-70 factor (ECF subfamily)